MTTDPKKTDRYLSFHGIDCDGNSRRLVALLRRHIDDPAKSDPFWEGFKRKLAEVDSPVPGRRRLDELFLIHAYINNLEEIFERHDDHAALALLRQIEQECC